MSIQSFDDRDAERFFKDGFVKKNVKWSNLRKTVARKLDMLNYAEKLSDLASVPGNRLEPLKGGLLGFYSIRINDQQRIVFRWTDSGPQKVRITDYH